MPVPTATRSKGERPGLMVRWARWVLIAGIIVVGIGGVYIAWANSRQREGRHRESAAAPTNRETPSVQVTLPRRGGLVRTTNQPGTIRAFEFAPLYSKIEGYLQDLKVDRGDHVKRGQLLAEIFDPELETAVRQAEAALEHARAFTVQAEARIKTAILGVQAAEARRNEATSTLEASVSQRTYRKKALDRISDLASRNAVEPKLVDEYEDQYMTSLASEHSAQAGIQTAEAHLAEAKAAVEQARAELVTAKAGVKEAEASLKRASVMYQYTRIESPFDGVVTYRGEAIHRGAFIRPANESQSEPLVTVARADLMRTIVQIPDRDVPFCNVGDPATVVLDAITNHPFRGKVSRLGDSLNLQDRTMRIEVDLPNTSGLLRDGMWGRVEIELEPPSYQLTLPAASLVEHDSKGRGAVYVVRDGKVQKVPITIGRDNGVEVEVLNGLSAQDQVIAQPTSATSPGLLVKADRVDHSGEASATGQAN